MGLEKGEKEVTWSDITWTNNDIFGTDWGVEMTNKNTETSQIFFQKVQLTIRTGFTQNCETLADAVYSLHAAV